MDGQTERVNQILEDLLRACVMEYQGSWNKNLPWTEFSYNNNYKESLKMVPFEVLYGRRCRTPLNWIEPGEKVVFGPDIIEEVETIVHCVQENLKDTKSRQVTYANKRRRPLAFEVGDHVYLRVSPMKDVKRFGVKRKLAPRYIGPVSILEKCGTVAYKFDLPPPLAGVHDEGPKKATRGGEWEPIKISLRNLAYIPNSTRHPSLLTQSRPHNYSKTVGP
jgi:hypothetical protein